MQISFAPTSPDTIGNTYLLALVSASVAANGSETTAVLATANEASVGVSDLFAFTAQSVTGSDTNAARVEGLSKVRCPRCRTHPPDLFG